MKTINELLDNVKKLDKKKFAVVCAHDLEVIEAARKAKDENIAEPVLFGVESKIKENWRCFRKTNSSNSYFC